MNRPQTLSSKPLGFAALQDYFRALANRHAEFALNTEPIFFGSTRSISG